MDNGNKLPGATAETTVYCANPDHTRKTPAVTRMSWPGGWFKPTTGCVGCTKWTVDNMIRDGHAVVVEPIGDTDPRFNEPRPRVVVLCGSTRFYDEFQQANYDLTMKGRIVLSVGFYPHAKAQHGHGEGVGHDSAEKLALDELHKRKIDLADEVLVLNVGGYIGESTRGEIEYAEKFCKPISYLQSPVAAEEAGDA